MQRGVCKRGSRHFAERWHLHGARSMQRLSSSLIAARLPSALRRAPCSHGCHCYEIGAASNKDCLEKHQWTRPSRRIGNLQRMIEHAQLHAWACQTDRATLISRARFSANLCASCTADIWHSDRRRLPHPMVHDGLRDASLCNQHQDLWCTTAAEVGTAIVLSLISLTACTSTSALAK